MSYIKRIILRNFKSHEETIVDLDPGVNVIYGDPQAGKSNIIRGLELLKDNRPRGVGFMPNFMKKGETEVAIIDSDGVKIGIKCVCHKTKKGAKKRDSTYYYIEDSKNESFWDATGVGSDVPPEITKALNLTDINMQLQKDPPFLATKSGSKIAKTVNKITGLDVGDQVVSLLNRKYNEVNAVVKSLKSERKTLKTKKIFFTNLNDLKDLTKRVRTLDQRIDKERTRIQNLESTVAKIDRLESSIVEPPDLTDEFIRAAELNDQIDEFNKAITRGHKMVARICALEIEVADSDVVDVSNEIERVHELIDLINNANATISMCNDALEKKNRYTIAKSTFDAAVKKYLDKINELKTCPLCFSKVDEDMLVVIEEKIRCQTK